MGLSEKVVAWPSGIGTGRINEVTLSRPGSNEMVDQLWVCHPGGSVV